VSDFYTDINNKNKQLKELGWKETNLPNIRIFPTDICLLPPDGTTLTDVRTENMDVREVGFHPPKELLITQKGHPEVV